MATIRRTKRGIVCRSPEGNTVTWRGAQYTYRLATRPIGDSGATVVTRGIGHLTVRVAHTTRRAMGV